MPKTIHQCPAGNAEQPRTQFRAVAEAVDSAEYSQPHILCDVPRLIVATSHPPDVLPDRPVPSFHELVEGWPLAKLAADDEKLVFTMRKMSRFAVVGHVCSIPLILGVVDVRKRFIQPMHPTPEFAGIPASAQACQRDFVERR